MFVITRPMVISLVVFIVASAFSFAQEMPQFNTDQEKQDWIEQNPSEYERLTKAENAVAPIATEAVSQGQIENIDLPGFPVYINTGNPEEDAATYQKAKELWIEQNRSTYQNHMLETNSSEPTFQGPSISDLPNFPRLIDTGNPELDYELYKVAKIKWYTENQQLVDQYYEQHGLNKVQEKPIYNENK